MMDTFELRRNVTGHIEVAHVVQPIGGMHHRVEWIGSTLTPPIIPQ